MDGLKRARLKHRQTLKDMAELTNVTPANYNLIERGLAIAHLSTREKIEKVLGKVNWLDTPKLDVEPVESTWNDCERQFRRFYRELNGLPLVERICMAKSAIKHLKRIGG